MHSLKVGNGLDFLEREQVKRIEESLLGRDNERNDSLAISEIDVGGREHMRIG